MKDSSSVESTEELLEILSTVLPMDSCETSSTLADLGFDSMGIVALQIELSNRGLLDLDNQKLDFNQATVGDLLLLIQKKSSG